MYHLIINPAAGRGFPLKVRDQVEAHFAHKGWPLEVWVSEAPGHATEIAKHLPEDAKVLALGGDGTIHEIAAACIGTNRTLGVLPAGTGDDFAWALGIGRHDLATALQVITCGKVKAVDTGVVNGDIFINTLGLGFDAEVAHTVRRAPGIFKGITAYFYAIIATLSKLEDVPVTVHVDDQEFYQGPALLVAMQNGPRTAGSFFFMPQASVTDGLLDVLVAGRFSRSATLALLPQVMRGKHLGHPRIFHTRGKRVRVRWERPRAGHMEGELLGASKAFDVDIRPASLRVFCRQARDT